MDTCRKALIIPQQTQMPCTRGERIIHRETVQGEGGVTELIYKQNDNQLQWRQSWKTAGGETEIGEGLWATGRLWLPSASGWSSLSSGAVVERLHYEPDPEHVGTSEADAPRSQLVPGVRDSKRGTGDDNDETDDGNDDRLWTASLNILLLL